MDNKGFTMVELLVSMAIMGLLIIMAFPTIRAIQTNNNKTKYEEYGKTVLSASKLYTDSYEEDLFDLNEANAMKSIDLNELVKKDLLKDISVSDTTCLNGSSVNIIKYKDDYTYCLNLICTTGGKEVYSKISKEGKCKDLTLYKVTYSYGSTNHVVSVVQGNNHTVLTPGAAHITIPNGYKFVKWNSSIGKKKAGEVIEVNSDIEFTPEIEPIKYKLRFDSSLSGAGTMTDQECKVGEPCKIKNNEFSKDYYSFSNYKYNSKTYNPGDDIKNDVNITYENQVVNVTASFRKNKITINYYSNGATLKPNVDQRCSIKADCPKNDSKCYWKTHWTEVSGCKAKSGLVQTVQMNFDAKNFAYNNNGMPNYDDKNGSALYMTRSGCTGTNYWHIGSATSSNKINEYHTQKNSSFATMASFANDSRVGKGEAFKKGDVTVDVFAGWNCPTYTLTIKKDDNINSVKMDGVNTTSKKVKYGTTVKVEVGAKDYFHTKWADNNSTSTSRSVKVTKDMTLTVKSVKNQLVINQYSAGGKLTPGNKQLCRKLAGCGNNECLDNPEANNSNEVAKCKNASGLIYVGSPDTYDTTVYNKDGLRDYATKSGATLYLTRTNCTATKYWHVGSEYSSTKIHEDTKYKNAAEFVKACGASYSNDFKKKNISINLYAGWNCPNEIKCSAGTYLPKGKIRCETCLSKYYCVGGVFKKNTTKNQGLTPCPTGYGNSPAGSSKNTQCYMSVSSNNYVKTAKATKSTACSTGYTSAAHKVNFTKTSKCSAKKVVVTFDCNGGKTDSNQTFTYDVTGQKFGKSCTRTGYKQDGWKLSKTDTSRKYTTNNDVINNWINTNSPSITLYAHWKINTYTLKYNDNGGSGCSSNSITKNYNNEWGNLCIPSKKNYIFTGWYDGNTRIYKTSKATKNITVTAHWLAPYKNQNGNEFTTLQAAINDNNSSTITLQRNYTDVNSSNFNKNRNITLDLNGQSLNLANYAIQVSAGTVKITNGTIETSGTKCDTVTATGGKLTIDKNANILSRFKTTTEYGTSALKVSGGTVYLYGKITSGLGNSSGYARGVYIDDGTFNMYNGSHLLSNATMPKKDGGKGSSGINCNSKTKNGKKVYGNVNIYGGTIEIMMGDTNRGVIAANYGTVKVKGTSHLIWKGSMGGGTFFYAKYGSICYENSVKTDYNPEGHSNFTYVGNEKGSITKKENCN